MEEYSKILDRPSSRRSVFEEDHENLVDITKVNKNRTSLSSSGDYSSKDKLKDSIKNHSISVAIDDDPLLSLRKSSEKEIDLVSYSDILYGNDIKMSFADREKLLQLSKGRCKNVHLFDVMLPLKENELPSLGVEISALEPGLLVVTQLWRKNYHPGIAEAAGIYLGDVIFGVNYTSCADKTPSYLHNLISNINSRSKNNNKSPSKSKLSKSNQKMSSNKNEIYLQCWRCTDVVEQDNGVTPPGVNFTDGEHAFIFQAYKLRDEGILTQTEMSSYINVLLDYIRRGTTRETAALKDDANSSNGSIVIPVPKDIKQNNFLFDMERNIFRAKGLRPVLCVRMIQSRQTEETVLYVMRVEDVESGHSWVVRRRYRDFASLQEQLQNLAPLGSLADVPKVPHRITLSRNIIESRLVGLEDFTRSVLFKLSSIASMDRKAARALLHIQKFLGVGTVGTLPDNIGKVDDQRTVELAIFRALNDPQNIIYNKCKTFVANFDVKAIISQFRSVHGYKTSSEAAYHALLLRLNTAVEEVSEYLDQAYGEEQFRIMRYRKPNSNDLKIRTFVKKCIRRQVEASIYLPLRRVILEEMRKCKDLLDQVNLIRNNSKKLQAASPSHFGLPDVLLSSDSVLQESIETVRQAVCAYLPIDQRLLLVPASRSVIKLHSRMHDLLNTQNNFNVESLAVSHASKIRTSPVQVEASSVNSPQSVFSSPVPDHVFINNGRKDNSEKATIRNDSSERGKGIEIDDDKKERQSFYQGEDRPSIDLALKSIDLNVDDIKVTAADTNINETSCSIEKTDRGDTDSNSDNNGSNVSERAISSDGSIGSDGLGLAVDGENGTVEKTEAEVEAEVEEIEVENELNANGALRRSRGASGDIDDLIGTEALPQPRTMSADEFLPLFAFVLSRIQVAHLPLYKAIMNDIGDSDESGGEVGYYIATMDAAYMLLHGVVDSLNSKK